MTNFGRCQREFMLDVFRQDAAEEQIEYLTIHVRLPWEMMLRPWVSRIRDLSRAIKYLPCLADSDDAPKGEERANVPLNDREICHIIMRAIPSAWREEYRCTPEGRFTPTNSDELLRRLEPIETREKNKKRRIELGGERIPKK